MTSHVDLFESAEVTTTGQGGISNWADCMIIWVIWGLTSCFLSTGMLFHTQRRREPIRRPDYLVARVSVLEGSKFNLPDLQRERQSRTDFCQTSSISSLLKFAGFHESTGTSAHRGEVRGRRGNRWAQTENNKPPNDGKQPRAARTDAATPADAWNTELRPTTQRVCKILDRVSRCSAESDRWVVINSFGRMQSRHFWDKHQYSCGTVKTPSSLLSFRQLCIPIVRHLKDKALRLPFYLPGLWTINNVCVPQQFCSDCRNNGASLWPSLHLWIMQSE